MKIILYGDSITDMGRDRNADFECYAFGCGYSARVAGDLYYKDSAKYTVLNRGISGDRSVDLYARLKEDVWNLKPDVLSILIGINDFCREIGNRSGVDPVRFEKVYRAVIEETREKFPAVKFILMEPFVLKGSATEENFDEFTKVKEYAAVVEKLAKEYDAYFLPLQKKMDEAAERLGAEYVLYDGIHPSVAGAKLIADEWLGLFYEKVDK